MIESMGDLTALIAAVGVLVGSIGAAAAKIGACLSDLRRQTARVQSTANKTSRAVDEQRSESDRKLDGLTSSVNQLNEAFIHRIGMIDGRLDRIVNRIERLERREEQRI